MTRQFIMSFDKKKLTKCYIDWDTKSNLLKNTLTDKLLSLTLSLTAFDISENLQRFILVLGAMPDPFERGQYLTR
jgi:hypothetical protein